MEPQPVKRMYSVWAIPPDDVRCRLKHLMSALRSEFGGPEFEPHVTVVGAIELTEDDAVSKFRAACDGVRVYTAVTEKVASGNCVFLLINPTPEVGDTRSHCIKHFGYQSSILQNLSEEEMKRVVEKANELDESIGSLSFQISSLALYETDPEDKTLKSWKKVAECTLTS